MSDRVADPCELLDWDSGFFGFRIARMRSPTLAPELAREVDQWCDRHGVTCLYFLAGLEDHLTARTAEDAGFRLVDMRITRVYPIAAFSEDASVPERFAISTATPEHLDELRALARVSHRTTRFYFDGRFPHQLCDELYARWITRAFEEPDQTLLVVELDGRPVGYASYALRSGTATQGLMAIADRVKGSRIAPALLRQVFELVRAEGGTRVIGTTQARSVPINRLLERSGFRFQKAELWFHKWYAEPDAGAPG